MEVKGDYGLSPLGGVAVTELATWLGVRMPPTPQQREIGYK